MDAFGNGEPATLDVNRYNMIGGCDESGWNYVVKLFGKTGDIDMQICKVFIYFPSPYTVLI